MDRYTMIVSVMGQICGTALLITLITCVFYVGVWEILYFTVLHDFPEKYANYMVEKARASGATPAQIAQQMEQMKQMKALLDNPVLAPLIIFISEPLPVGLVITLISAAILRKRRRVAEVPV